MIGLHLLTGHIRGCILSALPFYSILYYFYRQFDRQIALQIDRQIDRQIYRIDRWIDTQNDRMLDIQSSSIYLFIINKETDRQTDRYIYIESQIKIQILLISIYQSFCSSIYLLYIDRWTNRQTDRDQLIWDGHSAGLL